MPIICVISGKKNLFNTEYYESKAEKFGSKENLSKYYITQEVKRLLEKNLTVKDIRSYLKVDFNNDISEEYLKDIKKFNNISTTKTSNFAPLSVFTCFETDNDVKEYLKTLNI